RDLRAGRLRRAACGTDHFRVALGQLVGQLEGDERLVQRPDGALNQQLQAPWCGRIEFGRARNDEDADLLQCRRTGRLQRSDAAVLAIVEADGLRALYQLDAIEDAAAHVARSLERIGSFASDQNRVLP